MTHQVEELSNLAKQKTDSPPLWGSIAGVIVGALLAGVLALGSQVYQARQGRLIKAIEIIMSSRSGYQADLRKLKLDMFLGDKARGEGFE